MELSLTVTKASKEDIAAITRLINSAYRGEPGSRGWTSEGAFMEGERTSEAGLSSFFDQPEKENFKCCTPDNEIVGFMSLEKKEESLYLGLLSVSPKAQANGVGRRLLEFAEAHARSVRKPAIVITVIDIRTELVAWYERRGYLATGKTTPFLAPGYGPAVPLHLVEMKKEIRL
ncbi:MAG TPA: GNAT family N-acetyltransferase [Puia sp.]